MSIFGRRGGGGRRAAPREAIPLVAVFTTVTGSYRVELVDIATNGARLRGTPIPNHGEEVILTVEKLRAYGLVVWAHEEEFGITFDLPLAEENVDSLRNKVARTAGLSPDMRLTLDLWSAGSVA